MSQYEVTARGPRRSFKITAELTEGFAGRGRVTHHALTLHAIIEQWMKEQILAGNVFLSGHVTETTLHYVSVQDGIPVLTGGPTVNYEGEVSVRRLKEVPDEIIIEALNNLAAQIAEGLNQQYVIVSYRDETWSLERSPA